MSIILITGKWRYSEEINMNEPQVTFFVLTSLLVILIPGQDLVLVMSRGMTQGAKAGVATAMGSDSS